MAVLGCIVGAANGETDRARQSIDRKRRVANSTSMDVPYELSTYIRVLKLASTPSWEEFSQVSKIAAVGILLVGLIGFLIFAVMSLTSSVGA